MIDFHTQLSIIPAVYETATLQDNLEHSGGITLSWKAKTDDEIPVGSFITYGGIRYILLDQYAPTRESKIHYQYNSTFKHPTNLLDRVPFWIKMKDAQGQDLNLRTTSFTGLPHTIAQKLCDFMAEYANETGDEFFAETVGLELTHEGQDWDAETNPWKATWTFNIPDTNDKAIITVPFDGSSIKGAANAIADAMACNVFWDWNTRKLMFTAGTTITGETYNCFHVLGGTTNMGKTTTSGGYAAVTQRLTLADPVAGQDTFVINGRTYRILKGSIISGAGDGMRMTKDLILDDVYPKMELYINTARQRLCRLTDENGNFIVDHMDGSTPVYKKFAKWYVTFKYSDGTPYVFDPEKLINDKALGLLFQIDFETAANTSPLAGRQFDLTYFPKAKPEWDKNDDTDSQHPFQILAGEFYIAFTAEGEQILPGMNTEGMYPKVGDKVTLVNVALTSEEENAKTELLDSAKEIIGLMTSPSGEYTETMFFSDPASRVSIGSESPFDKTKHGPIVTSINHNLDTDVAEVTVGAWSRKTKTGGTADKLETVTVSANAATTGGDKVGSGDLGSGYYGQKENDTITETQIKPDTLFTAQLSIPTTSVDCTWDGKVKAATDLYTRVWAYYGTRNLTDICNITLKTALVSGISVHRETSASGTSGSAMVVNRAENLSDDKYWLRIHINKDVDFTGLSDMLNIAFAVNHQYHGDRDVTFGVSANRDGKDGASITRSGDDTYRYATNNTGVRPAASSQDWSTTKPTLQAGYWLFTETTIHWSDGSTTVLYTDERNPNDGIAGQDIIVDGATIMKYYVGTSNTTHPADDSSEWKDLSQVTQEQGKWLWSQATTWYRKAGSSAGAHDGGHSINYNVSYISKDGLNGRGISSITEYYQATNSSAARQKPSSESGWSTDPNLSDLTDKWDQNHKYLWNMEKTVYSNSDGTTTTDYSIPQVLAIWTKDGASGRGIDSIVNYYKVTNTITAPSKPATPGTEGWDDDPITPGEGQFLWNYEVITWVNGTPATTETDVQMIGHYGINGTSVRAQYSANGSSWHDTFSASDIWMRTSTDNGTTWSTAMKIVGESGGETDFSFGISEYKTTADVQTPPSDISSWSDAPIAVTSTKPYLWAKVQQKDGDGTTLSTSYIRLTGEDGKSITRSGNDTYRYALSTDGINHPTSGWSETKPSSFPTNQWLWTETTIHWSDNSTTVLYTAERNPNDGVSGQDIVVDGSTEMKYYVGDSNTTHPAEDSSDWKDLSQVTQTQGKWLWSKATTWYRKSSSAAGSKDAGHSCNYTVGYIAKDGAAAAAGRGITSVTEYYKATNSSAGMPTPSSESGWSTDPNLSDLTDKWDQNHRYLWNYEKVTYDQAPTTERTVPQILAIWTKDGANGADGKGIDSITNYYKVTDTATTPSKPSTPGTGGWYATPQAPNASNPYLWNYEVISWTDGSTPDETDVQLIGHFGKDGVNTVRLALDNEYEEFIYSDSQTLPIVPSGGSKSPIHFFDGQTEKNVTPTIVTNDATKTYGVPTSGTNAPSIITENNVKKLKVPHLTANSAKVTVKVTYNGQDYFAEFTANKSTDDKYELNLKPSSLAYNSATYQEKTIRASVVRYDKQGNKTTPTVSTSSTIAAGNYYIFYGFVDDNGDIGTMYNLQGTSRLITAQECWACTGIYFELRYYNNASDLTKYRLCDYETVEIAKAENGADGQNGHNGSDGLQGCVVRVSEWKEGVYYRNDEGETLSAGQIGYIDVVSVVDTDPTNTVGYDFYRCKQPHTSSNSNIPPNNTYWEYQQDVGPIYTSLLIAKDAHITFGTGNQFVITNNLGEIKAGMKGTSDTVGGNGIRIWAGSATSEASDENIANAPFRVYNDGSVVMTNAEVKGTFEAINDLIKMGATLNPITQTYQTSRLLMKSLGEGDNSPSILLESGVRSITCKNNNNGKSIGINGTNICFFVKEGGTTYDGYTGSVTISGKTLTFKGGILVSVS